MILPAQVSLREHGFSQVQSVLQVNEADRESAFKALLHHHVVSVDVVMGDAPPVEGCHGTPHLGEGTHTHPTTTTTISSDT